MDISLIACKSPAGMSVFRHSGWCQRAFHALDAKHRHESTCFGGCLVFGHQIAGIFGSRKLEELDFTRPDFLLHPQVGGSEMPYSPQGLALENADHRGGVGVDLLFDKYSEIGQD